MLSSVKLRLLFLCTNQDVTFLTGLLAVLLKMQITTVKIYTDWRWVKTSSQWWFISYLFSLTFSLDDHHQVCKQESQQSIYTHRSLMAKLDQHQFLLITLTGSALSKIHDGEPICTKPGAETEAATWNSAIIHFIVYTCSLTTVKKRIKHVEENINSCQDKSGEKAQCGRTSFCQIFCMRLKGTDKK